MGRAAGSGAGGGTWLENYSSHVVYTDVNHYRNQGVNEARWDATRREGEGGVSLAVGTMIARPEPGAWGP